MMGYLIKAADPDRSAAKASRLLIFSMLKIILIAKDIKFYCRNIKLSTLLNSVV